MQNQDNIQDELKGMNSELPPPTGKSPFTVPEGYFDGLAASVMARIKESEETAADETAALSPLLASISRTMPYSVPAGYFEENLAALPAFTGEEPRLSLPKGMPYTVPAGYFDNLAENIVSKVQKPQAKVVSMGRKWMRLMAAAVVAGIIGLTGYLYFAGQGTGFDAAVPPAPAATAQAAAPVAQELKNVSTKELDEFIKTTDVTATSTETVKTKHSERHTEVKDMLDDVSDHELDVFLNQVPIDDEELNTIN